MYWIRKHGTSLKFIGDGEAMLALADSIREECQRNAEHDPRNPTAFEEVAANVSLGETVTANSSAAQ